MRDFELDFIIRDHPHLGYRKEDVIDLENARDTDILHGAFMGDVVLRVPGADFSTPPQDSGWRGLVEWCLKLDAAIRDIRRGVDVHEMPIADSSDVIIVTRREDELIFSCTYSDASGRVDAAAFLRGASEFIRKSIEWIRGAYPSALRNVRANDLWRRLSVYEEESSAE